MIYLDASALVTLVAGRTHVTELETFLASRPALPLATSTVGLVETVRTIDRIGSYPTLMADLVRDFTEILVTEEIRDGAALLPQGLRTLDALHVASAQALGESLDVLITYDRRMFDVAHAVGLPVAAPGLPGPRE